jgi:3-hydroxyacyl-CoA dehydrogenase
LWRRGFNGFSYAYISESVHIGLHFFSPAYVMRLMEVVVGAPALPTPS